MLRIRPTACGPVQGRLRPARAATLAGESEPRSLLERLQQCSAAVPASHDASALVLALCCLPERSERLMLDAASTVTQLVSGECPRPPVARFSGRLLTRRVSTQTSASRCPRRPAGHWSARCWLQTRHGPRCPCSESSSPPVRSSLQQRSWTSYSARAELPACLAHAFLTPPLPGHLPATRQEASRATWLRWHCGTTCASADGSWTARCSRRRRARLLQQASCRLHGAWWTRWRR